MLNQDDQPSHYDDYPDYALLLSALTNGLQNLQGAYGQQLVIDSGYRSPKVNQLVELANGDFGVFIPYLPLMCRPLLPVNSRLQASQAVQEVRQA